MQAGSRQRKCKKRAKNVGLTLLLVSRSRSFYIFLLLVQGNITGYSYLAPRVIDVGIGPYSGSGACQRPARLGKSSLRCPLAAHTLWQRLVSVVDDGRLGGLHVGPAVGS